jgi:ribosomal protein S18 acetylase RimI-like enzyme
MDNVSSVAIVRAGQEHLDDLARLFDAYRGFYEQPSDLQGARAYLSERLANDDSVIFLALEGGEALGFTQLYPSFASLQMGPLWILYDLYVVPEARRRGVGRALLERARRFGTETGAVSLELSTAIDNEPAQALYESLGWVRDTEFYNYELELS